MEKARPSCLEIAWRICQAKSFLHQLGPLQLRPTEQHVHQFNFTEPAEERQNHRLNRQIITAGCERVAPRFEIMRQRDVPLTERGRGVFVVAQSNDTRHFLLQFAPIQRQLFLRIFYQSARRVIDRVTTENE